MSGSRKLQRGLVAVLLVALGLAAAGCSTIRAGMLVRDALEPAGVAAGAVVETRERVAHGAETVGLRIAKPSEGEGPWPAVLLIHGAVGDGPDDARMVAMAHAFAAHGLVAGSVDLPSLRALRIDPADPGRIAAAAAWLASRSDLAEDGRVALAGVSIGGSYGLVASGDPSLEKRLSAVLSFGGYADVETLVHRWMTTESAAPPGLYDPHTEGRRLVLLGNLDRLVPPAERAEAERVVRALLDERNPAPAATLSEPTQRVLRAAAADHALPDREARHLLQPFAADVAALRATHARPPAGVPVFLLHATSDPIVPSEDTHRVAAALTARGVEVDVHVTDLFGHVGAVDGESPSIARAWPLLRFLARFLGEAGW